MDRALLILLILAVANSVAAEDMRWDRWSWSMPQEPIEYFFRRNQQVMPVKSPNFQCDCPPHKECIVEYKINEASADFLNLRGLMKEEELKKYNEEIKEIKQEEASDARALSEKHRERRRSGLVPANECCCPPRNVMMPTFITDNKFGKEIERMSNSEAPGVEGETNLKNAK